MGINLHLRVRVFVNPKADIDWHSPDVRFVGQKRTSEHLKSMSALPPKSGHGLTRSWYLLCAKSGHYALQRTSLFDHLVGAAEHGLRNSEAERAWHSCVSIYAL